MPFPKKMHPTNRRALERTAIDLEERADDGLMRLGEYPRYSPDQAAKGALQRAAKVLRRALETDDAAS